MSTLHLFATMSLWACFTAANNPPPLVPRQLQEIFRIRFATPTPITTADRSCFETGHSLLLSYQNGVSSWVDENKSRATDFARMCSGIDLKLAASMLTVYKVRMGMIDPASVAYEENGKMTSIFTVTSTSTSTNAGVPGTARETGITAAASGAAALLVGTGAGPGTEL
ncbi:hypothetical protein QBC36DRAFT_308134 [Triangularia setosa]|uniref:Uncharacterized protein n=1 Tax=Triangularia setosa TaxID=2587417 RepID=A0AAN7AAR7_9PEZI|nr:hypothetical protein QBC36DRAFT_308134 [Podospora setosa]